MSNIKVSIIVPVYNAEQYITEAMDSLLNQTMQDFEIICVDDGSEDHSMAILQDYAARDSRFKLHCQKNSGAGAARNLGMFFARGEYIYFFDSDDLCAPQLLEETVKRADETNADIVAFEFHRFYPDGKTVNGVGVHTEWLPEGIDVFSYKDCPDRIMNVINPTPWNKLYRRSFVQYNHLLFEEISSTNDVTFAAVSAAYAQRIAILKKDLYSYRIGITGTITADKEKSLNNVTIAVESAVRQALELPYHEEIDTAISYFCLEIFLVSFYRYVTNIYLPSVKEFYQNMRKFFRSVRFNDISIEDIKNERLFNRFQIIKKYTYSKFCSIYSKRLVVSVTSYPQRIPFISQVLDTIYMQVHPADEVVLWLAEEQFPEKENELPQEICQLVDSGKLTLRWCKDLKPHKKYFYAFQEYPDDIIVTIDDDLLYNPYTLERLFDSYLLYPDAVSAGRVHLMLITDEGKVLPYESWIKNTDSSIYEPSMQLIAIGVGGVLYPPHLLDTKMLDEEAIQATCLMADDMWLKAMELVSDVPVVLAQHSQGLKYVPGSQESNLWSNNWDGGNDEQLANIISWVDEHYGEGTFKSKLLSQGSGRNLLGVEAVNEHFRAERERLENKFAVANRRRIDAEHRYNDINRFLSGFISARIDIKPLGGPGNSVEILKSSGKNVKVYTAAWLIDENGKGCVVNADADKRGGTLEFKLRCLGNGTLKFTLRGMDMRDENNKRVPYWIDFLSFKVNDKEKLEDPRFVAHDYPCVFVYNVENGDELSVSVSWKSHAVGQFLTAAEKKNKAEAESADNDGNEKLAELVAKNIELEAKLKKVCTEKAKLETKLKESYAEKSEINAKLKKTYAEKSEINAKLKKTYAEKSEINAKLKKTYAEKSERGLEIKRLREQISQLGGDDSLPSVQTEIQHTESIMNYMESLPEKLKDRTIVSWGGYNYFEANIGKLNEDIKITHICAIKESVKVTGYEIIDKEEIPELKDPFVIISLAKDTDVAYAATWLKNNGISFTHLSFLINPQSLEQKYLKSIGGCISWNDSE